MHLGRELAYLRMGKCDKPDGQRIKAMLLAQGFGRGEPFYEGETELIGCDERRIPVLFTITFPAAADGDNNVLAFVVDIT